MIERNLLLQVVKIVRCLFFFFLFFFAESSVLGLRSFRRRIGSEGGIARSKILQLVLGRDDDLESRVSGRRFPWPVDLVIAL